MPRITLKVHGAGPLATTHVDVEACDASPEAIKRAIDAAAAELRGKRTATRLGEDTAPRRTATRSSDDDDE